MSPRWHPKRCRVEGCAAPPGMISARGYCIDHGVARMEANNHQLHQRRGPFFERWYEACHLRFEYARVLDEQPSAD